jgi:cyclopropane fatty-acyl-phospholipid synthase-like methyltransferase
MAKVAKKKSAKKKPAKKTKNPGIGLGDRLRRAWPFTGQKKKSQGSPSDDLFFEMLEDGLLDDGRSGNPEPVDTDGEDVSDAPESDDNEMVLPDSWPESRLHIVQRIWGQDFLKPGGEKNVIDLIRPLALNGDHTVLDIGAGLGGSSRTIARETGAWVSGYEANEDLARAAMELSKMAGLTRKAPIKALSKEGPDQKAKSVNAMFSKEALYKIEDKEAMLAAVHETLRPHAQVLLTDYVESGIGETSPELQAWTTSERTPAHLWTLDIYKEYFENHNYRVHVAEDITDKYYHDVVTGFTEFSNTIKSFRGNKEMENWSVKEAEFWVRRMAPFESGELRVCRIFAQKID